MRYGAYSMIMPINCEGFGEDVKIKPVHIKRETVCQFTGHLDNKSKEIYELDILECTSKNEFSLGEKSKKKVIWGSCHWHIEGTFMNLSEYIEFGYCIVIGNIHENPELCK